MNSNLTEHDGVTCNRCRESPIIGTRWKCAQCADFDLCSSCHSLGPDQHQHRHLFWRIQIGAHLTSIMNYNFSNSMHSSSTCNECNRNPIIGIRWLCEHCVDYDLCSNCYHAETHQNSGHPFRCIPNSASLTEILQKFKKEKNRFTCPICQDALKKIVFFCGHCVCSECNDRLEDSPCPICLTPIEGRITLIENF